MLKIFFLIGSIFFFSFDYLYNILFWKNYLKIENYKIKKSYKIAIIDLGFDFSDIKFKIHHPYNAFKDNKIIESTKIYDSPNKMKNENHGSKILNIIHYLLPNAIIIPIFINSSKDLPKALNHAIDCKADIISISLSFAGLNDGLPFDAKVALLKCDIPITISAGNAGLCLENFQYGNSLLNLSNEKNNIFIVEAIKIYPFNNWSLCSFTNFSKIYNLIKMPGENISSNFQDIITGNTFSGTSIAAPLAAVKALYLADAEKITIQNALILLQNGKI